ncbi:MAG TPA: DinB family protein [Candidatus Eisenbacteria bacterium]|nr:DinB family protein [Candidatus Eisenbacteria bacterium]
MSKSHERVIERLKSSGEEVRRLCRDLDEVTVSNRTEPEKWSVKEILAHLAKLQEVFEKRVDAILAKEGAPITSYDPENDLEFAAFARKSAEELWKGFEEGRQRLVGKLEKLAPADWHRKGSHPDYPVYDIHFAMEYMAHHEAHHAFQMFTRRPAGKTPH